MYIVIEVGGRGKKIERWRNRRRRKKRLQQHHTYYLLNALLPHNSYFKANPTAIMNFAYDRETPVTFGKDKAGEKKSGINCIGIAR